MRDNQPNGLELRWVEVRDDHGSHMEARWSEASAAAPAEAAPATPVRTAAHRPHAA